MDSGLVRQSIWNGDFFLQDSLRQWISLIPEEYKILGTHTTIRLDIDFLSDSLLDKYQEEVGPYTPRKICPDQVVEVECDSFLGKNVVQWNLFEPINENLASNENITSVDRDVSIRNNNALMEGANSNVSNKEFYFGMCDIFITVIFIIVLYIILYAIKNRHKYMTSDYKGIQLPYRCKSYTPKHHKK